MLVCNQVFTGLHRSRHHLRRGLLSIHFLLLWPKEGFWLSWDGIPIFPRVHGSHPSRWRFPVPERQNRASDYVQSVTPIPPWLLRERAWAAIWTREERGAWKPLSSPYEHKGKPALVESTAEETVVEDTVGPLNQTKPEEPPTSGLFGFLSHPITLYCWIFEVAFLFQGLLTDNLTLLHPIELMNR